MDTNIRVIRAIGAEFAARKLSPLAAMYVVAAVVLTGGTLWLTTLHAWWWLLAVPVLVLVVAGVIILLLARSVIRSIRPNLTNPQKTEVKSFVDKLERVAQNLQTPMFLIVVRVVCDVVWPRDKSYVKTIASDSTSLHKDLARLIQQFKI